MQSSPAVTGTNVPDAASDLSTIKPQILGPKEVEARKMQEQEHRAALESRAVPATGNPNATISDPMMHRVEARYDVVQNQSQMALIIPDLKTNPEDTGLMLYPGEVIKLSDYYSPMEINRSKGLRYAASKMAGIGDKFALIPLVNEEAAADFKLPERQKYPKGTILEDQVINDFDLRYEELEMRDAKREEKLLKKTLAGRVTRKHGAAPASV